MLCNTDQWMLETLNVEYWVVVNMRYARSFKCSFRCGSESDCLEGFPFHLWLGYGNGQLAWTTRAYQYGNSLNVLLPFSAVGMLCTKAAQYHLWTFSILTHVEFPKATDRRWLVAKLQQARAGFLFLPPMNSSFLSLSPQYSNHTKLDGELGGRSPVGIDSLIT